MKTSDQINEIAAAVSGLQSETKLAKKGSVNPHYKSEYAAMDDVWVSVRSLLGKYGIAIFQDATVGDTSVAVTTRICHKSGQWVEFGPFCIPFGRKDAHAVGSACTYAKRYALSASIGIVSGEEDDDGNKAIEPTKTDPPEPPAPQKAEKSDIISVEEAKELEILLASEDPQYVKDLLGYFSNVTNKKVTDFTSLSRKHYEAAMKSIMRRREDAYKRAKLEQETPF